MESEHFTSRINYSGDLSSLVDQICEAYTLGTCLKYNIIEVGYEDCNIAITTDKGKYVAKIFAKDRSNEEIKRYTGIIEKVIAAGSNHPSLLYTNEGHLVFTPDNVSLVLMEYIEGKTFYELQRAPNTGELKSIIQQAALINSIEYKPPDVYDSWAIPHIKKSFSRVREFMKTEDIKLVEEVISRYDCIPIIKLPHALVHGDFTKANVLRSQEGKMYILDFSVANWYPRIQELAVISANLLHDDTHTPLKDRCEKVASEYSHFNSLTSDEKKYLYHYSLAGVAMEFIGAHIEKYISNNDSEETKYWFSLGREGLKNALSE